MSTPLGVIGTNVLGRFDWAQLGYHPFLLRSLESYEQGRFRVL